MVSYSRLANFCVDGDLVFIHAEMKTEKTRLIAGWRCCQLQLMGPSKYKGQNIARCTPV